MLLIASWVATKDSSAPEGGSEISIEKLESQLNTLKVFYHLNLCIINVFIDHVR
jgi:hypothetical protein